MTRRACFQRTVAKIRRRVFAAATPLAVAVAGLALPVEAFGAELSMPVPSVVIYPGQPIVEKTLDHRDFIVKDEKVALFVVSEEALEGQVARRTLLPGQAIRLSDLKAPDLVKAGASVRMIYSADGLVITGIGTALRSAGAGESIRVRNDDSGTIVSGIVSGDGTIRIEG